MHHGISPPQDADLFGLIYGFRFRPGEAGRKSTRLPPSPACGEAREEAPDEFLSAAPEPRPCRLRALDEEASGTAGLFLRKPARGSRSTRIEHVDSALLAVVNDVVFNFGLVSSDVATLWVCARGRLLVSARAQPLRSVDKLRSSVKHGEPFRSPLQLLIHLLRDQGDVLTQIVRETSVAVDRIEDQLLALRLSANRADLGAMRRDAGTPATPAGAGARFAAAPAQPTAGMATGCRPA